MPTAGNTANGGTRGLLANAFLDSSWLKGPKFSMTPDWPLQPSEEILKSESENFDSGEVNTEPVYQETTANTASVASNVLTLEWHRYSLYRKLLQILAYLLRFSPTFSSNRTETGAITDPLELGSEEQKLFFLVKSESVSNETKTLLKICPLSKPAIIKDFSPSSVQTAFSGLKAVQNIWKLPTSTSITQSCLIANTLQFDYFWNISMRNIAIIE